MSQDTVTNLDPRVPVTTRAPRKTETDGIHYHFLTDNQFDEFLSKDAFREHGEYKGAKYGTFKQSASSFTSLYEATQKPSDGKAATKASNDSTHNKIQTTILKRGEDGSWGLLLRGGLQNSCILQLHSEEDLGIQVSNTLRPLQPGDCLLAVDGQSVAGRSIHDAQELLKQAADLVELTVLCRDETTDLVTLDEFMVENASDSEELKSVKADVRNDIHFATVPYTTRAPKEGEKDGVHYNFVTRDQFEEMIKNHEIIEFGESNGVYYGTRRLTAAEESTISRKNKFRKSKTHAVSSPATSPPEKLTVHHTGSFSNLGIELVDTNPGVFVSQVTPGSPAEVAGLTQAMQILAIDGSDLTKGSAHEAKQKLDQIHDQYEVVVRFNPRDYSAASRALLSTAGDQHVMTVILDRNKSQGWGLHIDGGVEEGQLVGIGDLFDVNYVAVSDRELKKGDCLLAVNGTSVAGSSVAHAAELLKGIEHDVELTILSGDRPGASAKLADFFVESSDDHEVVAAMKSDVKAATYRATIPFTTRPPREGEKDGVNYNFITRDEFIDLQRQGHFVEWGERDGIYYGTAANEKGVNKEAGLKRHTSRTVRALNKARQGNNIQTVLICHNVNGEWGLDFAGGIDEGVLPTIKSMDNVAQLAYTTPLEVGDHLLAVDGISVAGTSLDFVREQFNKNAGDIELTVLSSAQGGDLKQVFGSTSEDHDDETKMLQKDVRADIYQHKVPHTTRAPREGEVDGVDYHFVTKEKFEEMIAEGLFLEHGEKNGVYYGTSLNANDRGKYRRSYSHRVASANKATRPKRFTIRKGGDDKLGFDLTDGHKSGVILTSIKEGSEAEKTGLRPGMQILKVNGEDVSDKPINDVAFALQQATKEGEEASIDVRYLPGARNAKSSKLNKMDAKEVKPTPAPVIEQTQSKRIHLWSTPRSLSTALMYSFAQRKDTTVVDEPLYPLWLKNHPEVERPYREELLASGNVDAESVVNDVLKGNFDSKVVFYKHIAKQFENIDTSFLDDGVHIIATRNPIKVASSWSEDAKPSHNELSFSHLMNVYTTLKSRNLPLVVIDADLLLDNPEGVLREVCNGIGLDFQASMLSWPAGPKEYDGSWAPVWYKQLHQTKSFEKASSRAKTLDASYYDLVQDCFPLYYALRQRAVGAGMSSSQLSKAKVTDHGIETPVLPDIRNKALIASVNGMLVPREFAVVSAFDSAVQGGDAVWEGLRVYNGRIFNMVPHLNRLVDSAKAMAFTDIPTIDEIQDQVFRCLAINNMRDDVHIRLTLSRGLKTTSSMNPMFNVYGSTLIILPEWKPVQGAATYDNQNGITLVTASQRRNPPQCVDSKIHHCNLINNILPKIQANTANAADALMLDVDGFVSETNATNVFAVRRGEVITPHADYCLPGTTRQTVIDLCKQLNLTLDVRRVSLSEFHCADEVFTTGSMGELTPVVEIDGRVIGDGKPGPVFNRINAAFKDLTSSEGTPLPF